MNILERLLDYELSQSARHRRYLSLVMLSLENGRRELVDLLRSGVRKSDAVFFYEDMAVVLMGATAKTEAIKVVSRYGHELDGRMNIHCSISSFPDDGKTSEELMGISQQRLKTAMQVDHEAIVAQ